MDPCKVPAYASMRFRCLHKIVAVCLLDLGVAVRGPLPWQWDLSLKTSSGQHPNYGPQRLLFSAAVLGANGCPIRENIAINNIIVMSHRPTINSLHGCCRQDSGPLSAGARSCRLSTHLEAEFSVRSGIQMSTILEPPVR